MRVAVLRAVVIASALCSCAPPQAGLTRPRDAGRITQEEVDATLDVSAYDVIARLRPTFFMSRGSTSLRAVDDSRLPWVFLDGVEQGSISTLRSIPATSIAEIRLYRAWEATTRFGTGYMSGVIAVRTRR